MRDEGLEALLAGIAAAPEGEDPEAWVGLLPPGTDPGRARAALAALRAGGAAPPPPAARLSALRAELARRGLDGFVVPRADAHQGEYVARHAERLGWLTGFTGSAGQAVVLARRAAIFVDGRYTLQVRDEVDLDLYEPRHVTGQPVQDWLAEALGEGARLGFDPWLHTPDSVERLKSACAKAGAALVPCDGNPLDAVWTGRPPPPIAPVRPHPLEFAGQSSAEKRARVAATLGEARLDAAVLAAPDSLAWLLDLRGGDVPFTPLALGFALIHADATVDLFMDRRKFLPGLDAHLGAAVRVHEPDGLGASLDALAGRGVRIDPAGTAAWIVERLERAGARIERGGDPCALPKAIKNPVELAGMRAAHRRDGAALARFLAWLSQDGPGRSEIEAAERLLAFRRMGERFQGPSFPTISGAGPHGAIVHYRATPQSDRRLAAGMLYLVDSGAQYLDGTTDVTRTLAIGAPGAEERHRFTLVLKGHIALASARFPAGTTGSQLDAFARRALWDEGLDYDHGTGHGVGSFLGVHEGPQRIAKAGNTVALTPGMILSNEPGYYQPGAYGIRIENLVAVTERPPMLGFETLTLAPIDRGLVAPDLLSPAERAWLDAYHARVFDEIGPLVEDDTRAWLWRATRPLG